MQTIELKRMTDLQEKLSDILQPLLEIAEGKRNIEEWNDNAEKLLVVAQSAILAERRRIVSRAKDHYWDSLEKDRDMIILHIEALTQTASDTNVTHKPPQGTPGRQFIENVEKGIK